MSMSESYKKSGVDVEAGYKAVELMKAHVKRTNIPGVLSGLGGFGGLFELDLSEFSKPVLVSGTDGVGTKLKLAFLMDKHDTIGQDCVAMCVNDVLCSGARPLFFLDYIATGKLIPEKTAEIVKGIADGCEFAGCALVGGETAEMPGFYSEDEYDLAGFTVGAVNKDEIINSDSLEEGDVLIGISSSGVHSNGFSLVRKVFKVEKEALNTFEEELGQTLGESLLTPTRIYVKSVLSLMKRVKIKSLCHITGGGFYENIPRMLKSGLSAHIKKDSYKIPPIFELIKKRGQIPEDDMYKTFNMGLGMILAVSKADADAAIAHLTEMGEDAYIVGELKKGEAGVVLW